MSSRKYCCATMKKNVERWWAPLPDVYFCSGCGVRLYGPPRETSEEKT